MTPGKLYRVKVVNNLLRAAVWSSNPLGFTRGTTSSLIRPGIGHGERVLLLNVIQQVAAKVLTASGVVGWVLLGMGVKLVRETIKNE